MAHHFNCLSPGSSPADQELIQNVVDFWNELGFLESSGETTWGVLDEIGLQVTDCLSNDPPLLRKAEGLTAKASLLMIGQDDV